MNEGPRFPDSRVALVTGASGFLGSHLVEGLFQSGWEVRGLIRNPSRAGLVRRLGGTPILGDITRPDTLQDAAAGVDVVFHAAARVDDWGSWAEFESSTVSGTRHMLEAAARAGVRRFLHVSTVAIYDDIIADRSHVVTEDFPHSGHGDRTFGHYARAKVQAEETCWDHHRLGNLEVTVIRPAWIYGPRDTSIAPRLVEFLEGPWSCWIGREDPVADPIYVRDVVECALAAATNPAAVGQAYNVAPIDEIRLRDFLGRLCRELAIPAPRRVVPRPLALLLVSAIEGVARGLRRRKPPPVTRAGLGIFTIDRHHSPAKAVRDLGWKPRVDVDEGIRSTAGWLRSLGETRAVSGPSRTHGGPARPRWSSLEGLGRNP